MEIGDFPMSRRKHILSSFLFICLFFFTLIFQWVKTSDPEETARQSEGDEMMCLGPEEAKVMGQKEAEEEAERHFGAFNN